MLIPNLSSLNIKMQLSLNIGLVNSKLYYINSKINIKLFFSIRIFFYNINKEKQIKTIPTFITHTITPQRNEERIV